MADGTQLSAHQTWSTTFFRRKWAEAGTETPEIIRYLYERRAQDKGQIASGVALNAKSSAGLYESDFQLFKSEHPGVRKLVAWCDESIRQAASIANGHRVRLEELQTEISAAWAHISNDGGYHDAHYHPGASWCGIYYVQAGEVTATTPSAVGNGVSRFYSPLPHAGVQGDYGDSYLGNNNRVDIVPTDATLVLFPSYLMHSGMPYRGTRDRIVIAFNSRIFLKQKQPT